VNDVVYLYGFVAADAPAPGPLTGIADTPVRLLRLGLVNAVVSELPAAQFGVDVIEAQLQDLAWVGEHGLAHERVVTWYADHADILPARLFSLYSSDTALRSATAATLPQVRQALTAFAGKREWNLKVAYDTDELAQHGAELSDELRRVEEEIATAPPGRRYLLQRRRTDIVKREVSRMARTAADEILAGLAAHALDSRVLPVAAADVAGTVVLNAALLVARAAETGLRAEADRLYSHYTALGLIISFSGPWAPYRFLEHNDDA
jgi:hypothetical protein